jgi:uncharacterized HAD superfamily protein
MNNPQPDKPPQKQQALRYNTDKLEFSLLPTHALEETIRVMMYGSKKYDKNNWKRGLSWTSIIDCIERHLSAIKKGEDFDPESGLLHASHVVANALFLTEYYKIYPQGDDRQQHSCLNRPRIALDIDGVISDFQTQYCNHYANGSPATAQELASDDDNDISDCSDFKSETKSEKEDKRFWMTMKPKISPRDINPEPVCYITNRKIPLKWTEAWLAKNGFPNKPVYTASDDKAKVAIAQKMDIDIFIDDEFSVFQEFSNAGMFCYLFDTIYNQRYDVGHKRIYDLKNIGC